MCWLAKVHCCIPRQSDYAVRLARPGPDPSLTLIAITPPFTLPQPQAQARVACCFAWVRKKALSRYTQKAAVWR